MRRREFFTLVGGVAAAWPFAAHAQQTALPVIGFLHGGSPEPLSEYLAAFRKGLSETGYVEGQNVTIEFRWAAGQYNRLGELAAGLIGRRVAVIAAPLSTQAALAAKAATTTIPIVFGTGGDPVALGLVASFNRPGGNVTGVRFMSAAIGGKQLGLLNEMLPGAKRFAALVNPSSALAEPYVKDLQAAARTHGLTIEILHARTDQDIDAAFGTSIQKQTDALLIHGDDVFTRRLSQIVTLATRHALPTIFVAREFAKMGGLMSYGPNAADLYREVGNYTGRILKGEKPADLPVLQPTRFELVINLTTAKALGLTIPSGVLAIADEVIE